MADTNGLPGRTEQAPTLRAYFINTDALTEMIDNGHIFSGRGNLPGEWHYFPTTKEKIQEALKSIGIDGVKHKTYIIDKCDTDIPGLFNKLPRSADIDELNMLAAKLVRVIG